MKIVLLGSIPKGDDIRQGWTDWKLEYMREIKRVVAGVEFIHGDAISDNAGPELVVGHDLSLLMRADVCVVDAEKKIGAGTAQEMMYAKFVSKPLVSVIPKDSHHRKTNVAFHGVNIEDWVHPFLLVCSDYVAESIEGAARWIKRFESSPGDVLVKDFSVFDQAIQQYQNYETAHRG